MRKIILIGLGFAIGLLLLLNNISYIVKLIRKIIAKTSDYFEENPQAAGAIISAVMLFIALADMPYGYYTLLRVVVSISAAYVAVMSIYCRKGWAVSLFGVIAVLFNPLIPVHMDRDTWAVVDVICAIIFIASLFMVRITEKTNSEIENRKPINWKKIMIVGIGVFLFVLGICEVFGKGEVYSGRPGRSGGGQHGGQGGGQSGGQGGGQHGGQGSGQSGGQGGGQGSR